MESHISWIGQDPLYDFMDWLYPSDFVEPPRSPPFVDSIPGNEKISVNCTVV
ncbi:hypothetical protein J3459_008647 [Metarhizium acridum]|uniref:uncharacterized protein n=1 Tax=Metarhizium acridum TaxID=92637 RepID=UPI001C6BA9D6|nr:hypothetical protein J3459_019295 [Metarhizium acridum]KAG8417371.1 hypothetical protein J3458_004880 [Metarhizium acridum]KAG8425856.1 hypothetical protein J3459_008647 [Metarhizium acridum]